MKKGVFCFLGIIIIGLSIFMSCTPKSEIEEFDEFRFGYDYFPLEVGKYWIYETDSTIYDDAGTSVYHRVSQVKEEIVEEFEDLTGETNYRIERFWRSADSLPWQVTDVWVASADADRAYRTEENLKFIKFVFPPRADKKWDGNVYIDETTIVYVAGESLEMFKNWGDEYEFQSVDVQESIGENTYENVATVLLTGDAVLDSIDRQYALEKYARGVGLVYKDYTILNTQCICPGQSWEEKAEKGFTLKQTLIEHN